MHKLISNLARVAISGGAILLALTIIVLPRIATTQVNPLAAGCGGACGMQSGTSCTFGGNCTGSCSCGICDFANPYDHTLYCGHYVPGD